MVEQGADQIMEGAKDLDVAFLVVEIRLEPRLTTDLVLQAREQGNTQKRAQCLSIMNACLLWTS